MSIKIESEERKIREREGFLVIAARFQDSDYLKIGNYSRCIDICKTDPDIGIITEAIERYVISKNDRAKSQDKADKIEMLNNLLKELAGDINLVSLNRDSEPVIS